MGNKNGYDPSIRRGVHQFSHAGVWFTVCYWGSALEQFKFGDRVIFEGSVGGVFWLGTVERDCFVLISETPFKTVLDALVIYMQKGVYMNNMAMIGFADKKNYRSRLLLKRWLLLCHLGYQ